MVNYIKVTVPEEYPYVLLLTGLTNVMCLIVGFMAGSKRSKIFDREFMKQFDSVPTTSGEEFSGVSKETPKGGYPDMGNGFYGKELSYKDWFEFQLDQRAHKNFLEGITIITFSSLLLGLIYPVLALILICVYFVGRIVYTIGYKISPKARIFGAPFVMVTPMVMMGASIVGCINFIIAANNATNNPVA